MKTSYFHLYIYDNFTQSLFIDLVIITHKEETPKKEVERVAKQNATISGVLEKIIEVFPRKVFIKDIKEIKLS
jgi:hypothetical protein